MWRNFCRGAPEMRGVSYKLFIKQRIRGGRRPSPESIATDQEVLAQSNLRKNRDYGFRAPREACHRPATSAGPLARPRNDNFAPALRYRAPPRKYRSGSTPPRSVHGRYRRYRVGQCRPAAPSGKSPSAGPAQPAQAGLDQGQGAGFARLRRDARHRARPWLAHGVRGGRLSQYRRVLGKEARDVHDHGRHLHARLRLLQRQDRLAGRARCCGAGARRRRDRQARIGACGDHLGRPRRPRRRRRGAFRRRDPRHSRALSADHDRGADAGFFAQGRRRRNRGRGQAGRVQPQPRNRAVKLSHRAAGRALLRFAASAAAGQGARSAHLHQVGNHGRPRRGAE